MLDEQRLSWRAAIFFQLLNVKMFIHAKWRSQQGVTPFGTETEYGNKPEAISLHVCLTMGHLHWPRLYLPSVCFNQ